MTRDASDKQPILSEVEVPLVPFHHRWMVLIHQELPMNSFCYQSILTAIVYLCTMTTKKKIVSLQYSPDFGEYLIDYTTTL